MTEHVKPPGRVQGAIYATTKRLEGHTMALGLVVTAIGLFFAWVAYSSISGVPFQDRYEIKVLVPSDTPILQEGDAVRIAGRLAGLITDVQPGEEPGSTEVSADIRPAYAPIGKDAEAKVRVKSLVYLTYLEISPGDLDDPLPEGGTLPLAEGGSNVDLLEVVELFDRESRQALSKSIYNAGVGLADRGGELNAALRDVRTIAKDGTAQLEAIASDPGAIASSIRGSARIASGSTGERPDDVAGLLGSASTTLGTIANRRAELAQTIEEVRPFEDEFLRTAPLLDPVLDDAIGLSRELDPVLKGLLGTLPGLNRVLARGGEIRAETDRLTGLLRPVLRAATPVLAALQPTVASIDQVVQPLELLVSTVEPYGADIRASSEQVLSATSKTYPTNDPAGKQNPALRFAPIFGCHANRNPSPEPGEPLEQAAPC
jgi:phospholipid/cholesterol/gamma-HCH transport system substrate-binding protein